MTTLLFDSTLTTVKTTTIVTSKQILIITTIIFHNTRLEIMIATFIKIRIVGNIIAPTVIPGIHNPILST